MDVQIVLDTPRSSYTNLDIISGRVLLRVANSSNVSSVVVKLEGESKTRLMATRVTGQGTEKQRPVLEVHKVVFPSHQLQEETWDQGSYTLLPGQHEWPFKFKLPFNNTCSATNSLNTNVSFAGLRLEVAKQPERHVKNTLPPTLTGFPGEAEIRYYVKVTVHRPKFYQENPRAYVNFNLFPIEPPRPALTGNETYARRQRQFLPFEGLPPQKKGLFSRSNSTTPTLPSGDPPRFSVDARLPNPAILTCSNDLPLRVIVKQLSERAESVYLQMLQVELIGYTHIRAHDIARTESNSWIITSTSNMGVLIGSSSDVAGTETTLSKEYWYGRPLPNTVAPSFETCNIRRDYELEVRVGISYGSPQGKPQQIVLPLRLPVQIFSGIAPPPALLAAMANAHSGIHSVPPPPFPPRPASFPSKQSTEAQSPVQRLSLDTQAHQQQGTSQTPQPYEDAPPSYEDAIAQDMPPVDGPRSDYAPPPAEPDVELSRSEKTGWV
ncbi:hypothetical protein LTR04_005626 [Oleoguttula sp. CCFEE 6159]|nr:hypothetical protein LTR04_005626 [Oleoguttula sp. CCFEE 6159]